MKRKIIPYNPKLKQLARNLRNNSTKSEVILWKYLKGKKISGFDFHRQKPINNYIVDFYCSELFLAIEIDGLTHDSEGGVYKDSQRDDVLNKLGVTILRIDDKHVFHDIENVLLEIEGTVDRLKTQL